MLRTTPFLTLAVLTFAAMGVGPAEAGPALVCLPTVALPGNVDTFRAPTDGCGADLSSTCGNAMDNVEMESGPSATACMATYMGDCEVTEDGNTITGWAVFAELHHAGGGDYITIGLYCIEDDGSGGDAAVAECYAGVADTNCPDEGAPAAGGAYCVALAWDDESDGIPPEDWSYTAYCEDPVRTGLF